ncbi:MAG TPA: histidine kinase [Gemmatimonadaceae bacterium]|nr:histidine kinase [Gemmatimonadaceae bacterium]
MSRPGLVAAVCVAWIVIAAIVGAQATLGSALMASGNTPPLSMMTALRTAMIQTLPWIPVTLAAIALTVRFPMQRRRWSRHLPVHIIAALLLAFMANVLVVLGFWWMSGQFQGFTALARAGLLWATIRLHVALLVYAAILGITQAVLSQRRARARELHLARVEGQLARAQVQALNAQIRPHFLFNTLHTIGQLWRSNRSDDADAVLDHLGTLFHKVQASTTRMAIPLADELAMVREYLAIEEARYGDRLRTRVQADDTLMECAVPPLILQPIVENAVRHGIAAVSSAGRLEVRAERYNGTLRLTVSDDGPGLNGAKSSAGSGVGLRNTRERLQQLYGDAGRLTLSDAHGGTVVVIELPLQTVDEQG